MGGSRGNASRGFQTLAPPGVQRDEGAIGFLPVLKGSRGFQGFLMVLRVLEGFKGS